MKLLSDWPSLSVTRVCADDCGSALKSLDTFRRQASIVDLAAKCAGLALKPAKWVLIIHCSKIVSFVHSEHSELAGS